MSDKRHSSAPAINFMSLTPKGVDMATETLDTKGLNCPLPILKAKKAITKLESGDTLEVLATDPGAQASDPVPVAVPDPHVVWA